MALVVRNPPANAGDTGDWWLNPWVEKIPWRKGMATHYSILAWTIPMDRGVLWATVNGITEPETTEAT